MNLSAYPKGRSHLPPGLEPSVAGRGVEQDVAQGVEKGVRGTSSAQVWPLQWLAVMKGCAEASVDVAALTACRGF